MKKLILLTTIMITFALLGKLNAQVINLDDAQNIAQKSFAEIHSISAKSVSLNENYYVKTSNSLPVAYIFTESNGGFVIISGEERTIPVLAYSPEGTFDLDESNWPENFAYWMQTYCEQIELIRDLRGNLSGGPRQRRATAHQTKNQTKFQCIHLYSP